MTSENDPRYVHVADYAALLTYMMACASDIQNGRDNQSTHDKHEVGCALIDEALWNMKEKLSEMAETVLDAIAERTIVLELPRSSVDNPAPRQQRRGENGETNGK